MAISLGFFSLQNFRLHKQKSPKLKHIKFQHILARHRNPLRLQEALKRNKVSEPTPQEKEYLEI